MTKPKTRYCDECSNFDYVQTEFDFGNRRHKSSMFTVQCIKGHKLRFYKPKSCTDTDYGYKRVCNDFELL